MPGYLQFLEQSVKHRRQTDAYWNIVLIEEIKELQEQTERF